MCITVLMAFLTGIVLAAGAGTRMGRPKALMFSGADAWLSLAVQVLRDAGCDRVLVVLGAAADVAAPLVPAGVEVVVAHDWAEGLGASLRAALDAAAAHRASAALVTLVDLPGMPATVAARVAAGAHPGSLTQAVFGGRPGHPVLLGRDHWASLSATLSGDRGARDYLAAHGATEIECGDLFDGLDVDSGPTAGSPEAAQAAVLAIAGGSDPALEAILLANAYTDDLEARGLERLRRLRLLRPR